MITRKPGRRRRRRIGLPIALIAPVLLIAALLYDSNARLVVTEYELSYSNLPDSFDGYRIAVLSDTHASEFGPENATLISMVAAAKPDIIVIAGDVIDHDKRPPLDEQIRIAETLAAGLLRIAPVYYLTGNHEWDSGGIRTLLPMLDGLGVRILRNRYTLLEAGGEYVILAGTDDPNGPADMIKPAEFVESIFEAEGIRAVGAASHTASAAGAASPGAAFIIMLEHRNGNLQLYSELGVDLVLCGHAHGGIIRLPFTEGLIGPQREWFPKNTGGVSSMGGTNMVVSRGVGNHTGWPRFLNNPEVVVVELRKCD